MSAPQIPNLLASRTGSSRPRGRGRGLRGLGGPRNPAAAAPRDQDHGDWRAIAAKLSPEVKDKAVQDTDWDATGARQSAVDSGYLEDRFIHSFSLRPSPRRFPVINRGTYVRTIAIDSLLESWLKEATSEVKQIISLGAGSDTRYWRLVEKGLGQNLVYHEFDFPANGAQKHSAISNSASLAPRGSVFYGMQNFCNEFGWIVTETDAENVIRGYSFHGCDLRELSFEEKELDDYKGLRWDLPTVVISECCLCYLEPTAAKKAVDYFTTSNPCVGVIIYEPINPDDSFGDTMTKNLANRAITMPSLDRFKTMRDHKDRLLELKMAESRVTNIHHIWEKWIPPAERARVERLEMFDELEEWRLLGEHYVVAWGWRHLNRSENEFETFTSWDAFKALETGSSS